MTSGTGRTTQTDRETDLFVRETEVPHVQVNQGGAAAVTGAGDDRQTERKTQEDRQRDISPFERDKHTYTEKQSDKKTDGRTDGHRQTKRQTSL